jgi:hypothetical protein
VNGEKKFNPKFRFDGGTKYGLPGATHNGIPTTHINGKKIPRGARLPEPAWRAIPPSNETVVQTQVVNFAGKDTNDGDETRKIFFGLTEDE